MTANKAETFGGGIWGEYPPKRVRKEKFSDKQIEKLWKEFGNICLDDNDKIDTDFHIWKKGTDKFKIWHWFDDNHSKGLTKGLMHLK